MLAISHSRGKVDADIESGYLALFPTIFRPFEYVMNKVDSINWWNIKTYLSLSIKAYKKLLKIQNTHGHMLDELDKLCSPFSIQLIILLNELDKFEELDKSFSAISLFSHHFVIFFLFWSCGQVGRVVFQRFVQHSAFSILFCLILILWTSWISWTSWFSEFS